MKNRTGNILVVSLLVLLLIATSAAGYFYLQSQETPAPVSQTPEKIDEMENWKTYENARLGFSFKYPGDYFNYQEDADGGVYLAPLKGDSNEIGAHSPTSLGQDDVWLDAVIELNQESKSIEAYLSSKTDSIYSQKKPIKIVGIDGVRATYSSPAVAGNVQIFSYEGIILSGKNFYRIVLSSWSKEALQKKSVTFDQILSTFRFE